MKVNRGIIHKGNVVQLLLNIIYFFGSLLVFFAGMVTYGMLLNSGGLTLTEEMKKKGIENLSEVKLVVNKSNYTVNLYSDTLLVKSYKAVMGRSKKDVKRTKEDFVTPLGKYEICSVDTAFLFHKLLQLNYPNTNDIHDALRFGVINEEQSRRLLGMIDKRECPDDDTGIGTVIGLHGYGRYDFIMRNLPFVFNWTNGSIAMSNQSIDEIHSVVEMGTPVFITK